MATFAVTCNASTSKTDSTHRSHALPEMWRRIAETNPCANRVWKVMADEHDPLEDVQRYNLSLRRGNLRLLCQCRSRRMRCDQSRPTCELCRHAGLVCGGYEKNIFFDLERRQDADSGRFRGPLFTLEERKCMSELLVSTVPPGRLHNHLLRLDEECIQMPASGDIQFSRGPFGAFRVTQSQPPCPPSAYDTSETRQAESSVENDELLFPDMTLLQYAQFMDDPILEFDPSTYLTDPWNMFCGPPRITDVLDDESMPEVDVVQPLNDASHSQNYDLPQRPASPYLEHASPESLGNFPFNVHSVVSADAVLLVKHYSTTVLRLLTPFRHSKTPWHVLFVPHAKSCLAAIALGEEIDHASLCSFYGILAISAWSLGGVSTSQTWIEHGNAYKQQAREQAKSMLQRAYDIPKAAKYKSILMALLTMVQVSLVSGIQEQLECYLLEAEKFIRLKGLNRQKSRKVRLLHHCYAFERIFYESTLISTANAHHRHHIRTAIESSGLMVHSKDSVSFGGLDNSSNLNEDMLKVKSPEEGENDLHLHQPGIWSGTLYPEIFGVPESWLMLISLIIRLGKAKESMDEQSVVTANGCTSMSLQDFMSQAKSIDRYIQRLQKPSYTADLDNLLEAMHNSLAIYFYRRIYDIDASLLQPRVKRVSQCLDRMRSPPNGEPIYGAARYVWPAFIAACEAEGAEVQASFSAWFHETAQESGLRLFSVTQANIERKWGETGAGDSGCDV